MENNLPKINKQQLDAIHQRLIDCKFNGVGCTPIVRDLINETERSLYQPSINLPQPGTTSNINHYIPKDAGHYDINGSFIVNK